MISINQTEFDEWSEGPPITAAELGLEDAEDDESDESDDRPAVGTIRVVEPLVAAPTGGGASAGGGAVFIAVSTGIGQTCGLRGTGEIECWGLYNNAHTPAGRFSAVSVSSNHICGLREDSEIVCRGDNTYGQANAPAGRFSAVSVGSRLTCAVREGGEIVCWGANETPVTHWSGSPRPEPVSGLIDSVPSGRFSAVSAGFMHICAVRETGTVECWGYNRYGQSAPPAGRFSTVDAGLWHTCGLRESGQIVCWGSNGYVAPDPLADNFSPAGSFNAVSVSAWGWHICGLRETGTIECWGLNEDGQANAPAGRFTAVSAGTYHTCGLRRTGEIECWGSNDDGQTNAPPVGESPALPEPDPIIQYVQVFAGERWITYNCVGRDTDGDGNADLFLADADGNPLPNAAGVDDKCIELGWSSRPLPGDATTAVQTIQPPQIDRIRCSPSLPRVGEDVTCTATLSGGAPMSYSWTGGSSSSSSSRYTTSWSSAGTYAVSLTVGNDGGSDSDSTSVAVRAPDPEPPEISISCPAYAETGRSFSCTVRNRGGAVTSWDWSASGGTAGGRSETYSATFTSFGRHIVQLTASNAGGSDSDSTTVRLVAAPPSSQYSRCGTDTIKVYWFDRANFRKHHVDMTGEEATRILGAAWWATIGHHSQPACDSWPTGGPVTAESYR